MKIKVYFFILLSILFTHFGCRTIKEAPLLYVTINIVADNYINDGSSVSFDIICVEDSESILNIGPEDWFVCPKRKALANSELKKLVFSNGQHITNNILVKPGVERIILFAEYTKIGNRKDFQLILEPGINNAIFNIKLRENKIELSDELFFPEIEKYSPEHI